MHSERGLSSQLASSFRRRRCLRQLFSKLASCAMGALAGLGRVPALHLPHGANHGARPNAHQPQPWRQRTAGVRQPCWCSGRAHGTPAAANGSGQQLLAGKHWGASASVASSDGSAAPAKGHVPRASRRLLSEVRGFPRRSRGWSWCAVRSQPELLTAGGSHRAWANLSVCFPLSREQQLYYR